MKGLAEVHGNNVRHEHIGAALGCLLACSLGARRKISAANRTSLLLSYLPHVRHALRVERVLARKRNRLGRSQAVEADGTLLVVVG